MSAQRSYHDEVRERLLELWVRREEFGNPVGCVTSTFTFDAGFFEEECLGRFVGMDTHPQYDDERVYLVEREEKLSEIFSCVLVDRSHAVQDRSLRWHLLPITVPRSHIMHAKVTLLAWQNHVRVLVGSANMTEYGYRRNFEHMGVLDFGLGGNLPHNMLVDVVDFFQRLRREYVPYADEGPQVGLDRFLQKVPTLVEDQGNGWKRGQPSVSFLAQFPGDRSSLFERIGKEVWYGTGPSDAFVLSPFFDDRERSKETVDALVGIMGVQGERRIHFMTSGYELEDDTVELEAPEVLKVPWQPRMQHLFHLLEGVESIDKGEEHRSLHAKSLWLQRENRAVYMIGSSNFTGAGMGVHGGTCNIEANLVYYLPSTNDPFARKCENAYPPNELVKTDLNFRQDIQRQTHEGEGFVPLPEGFETALFRPEGIGGVLLLSIATSQARPFVVKDQTGNELLDWARWQGEGKGETVHVTWTDVRPPTSLLVDWQSDDGSEQTSFWVVNVTDTTLLPAPEDLRELELDMLIEILTSTRPLHEAVRTLIRRKERAEESIQVIISDPHKKVDASNYLLRKFRRIAHALEGLQERLERTAYNIEALRWRLRGPIGPVALAKRLALEEGEGAAFMISEVAMVLRSVDWAKSNEVLGQEQVAEEIEAVYSELEELASEHPSPDNLAKYVRESFAKR